MSRMRVTCVGATTIDIKACPESTIPLGTNVLGRIVTSAGGNARNMAESFAHLDCDCFLLSVLGDDIFASFALSETKQCGVHTEFVATVTGKQTARYVAMLDERGVPQYAVFDGDILEYISPSFIKAHSDLLASSELIITHTMMSVESLELLADIAFENATPLYVNLSSAEMAFRIENIFDRGPIVAANQVEAESLVGYEIESPEAAMDVAQHLIAKGASEVIITLGASGVVYSDGSNVCHVDALPARVIDATGAGDAFSAGFLVARLGQDNLQHCLTYGLAAAALTVESEFSICPLLSHTSIAKRLSQS